MKNRGAPEVLSIIDLAMGYGENILQQDISFAIKRGDIFVIMGGSGCGKSTLLKHLIGLKKPLKGQVLYNDLDFWAANSGERDQIMRRAGVLYQSGALWSSMTLAENVALPLQRYTRLKTPVIRELVEFKLALVGLRGFAEFYPAELSGGMRKRAALARAIALDPEYLFFDEPSAGLDPVTSRHLDELIIELRDSLGATVIIVTHELDSIYSIATNSVFLDREAKTMLASGDPKVIVHESDNPAVIDFLTRGTGKAPKSTYE